MKILSLSDVVIPFIYSHNVRERFTGVELIIGCGDLPYFYQEYVVSCLDAPLYFVRGNHDKPEEQSSEGKLTGPTGGTDLHRSPARYRGVLLAGVEGCLRYRNGPYQYSQMEMWLHVVKLVPTLLVNRSLTGRFLDIFVTHAPPRGIHDRDDLPHQGIDAFRWLIEKFQPAYHFHGHTHLYRPDSPVEDLLGQTRVVNTFGFRETIF